MFRRKIIKTTVSFEGKKRQARSREDRSFSSQRGSILIWVIVTMVIMATLGAGMLALTSTSTFHELFFVNQENALYTAESGGRYALSVIRDAYARDRNILNSINANQTFTLSNGSTFQIINWVQDGLNPETVSFASVGVVGSGFWQAKMQINYRIQPAYQFSKGGGDLPLPRDVSDFNVPKKDLDLYYSPVDANEVDIKSNPTVSKDPALNLKSACYTMGLKWYTRTDMAQLDDIRAGNGDLLNYGVQVKILVADYTSPYNIIGISFRLDDSSNTSMVPDNMYGISFVRMPNPKPDKNNNQDKVYKNAPDWYKNLIYENSAWDVFSTGPNAGKWHVVLWKRTGVTGSSGCTTGTYTPLAYKAITSSDWPYDASGNEIRDWSTLYINVEEKKAVTGNPYSYAVGTLYNEIKSYFPAYTRSTTDDTQAIKWDDQNLFAWDTVTASAMAKPGTTPAKIIIADSSLNTSNYDGYTDATSPKAREIGLHIFNTSTSAQNVFYDNFYIDLSGSGGGGGKDGSGSVIWSP